MLLVIVAGIVVVLVVAVVVVDMKTPGLTQAHVLVVERHGALNPRFLKALGQRVSEESGGHKVVSRTDYGSVRKRLSRVVEFSLGSFEKQALMKRAPSLKGHGSMSCMP